MGLSSAAPSVGMARIAVGAGVHVVLYAAMLVIRGGLVVRVAIDACKRCVTGAVGMAFGATDSFMRARREV